MSNKNTQGYPNKNLFTLKDLAINDLKVIYRSSITVNNTVKSLATDLAAILAAGLGKPTAATFSVVSNEATAVVARYTQDGTTPVAVTTGNPMYNKSDIIIKEYSNLQKFKIIEESSYTTVIEVTYYK